MVWGGCGEEGMWVMRWLDWVAPLAMAGFEGGVDRGILDLDQLADCNHSDPIHISPQTLTRNDNPKKPT